MNSEGVGVIANDFETEQGGYDRKDHEDNNLKLKTKKAGDRYNTQEISTFNKLRTVRIKNVSTNHLKGWKTLDKDAYGRGD